MDYRSITSYASVGKPERIKYGGLSILTENSGCLFSNATGPGGHKCDVYVGPYSIATATGNDGKQYELVWIGYRKNCTVNPNVVFAR